MKKYPGSIYTRKGSKRLYLEYRGEKISTHLPDTKENRKIAEQMLWTLWRPVQGVVAPSTLNSLSCNSQHQMNRPFLECVYIHSEKMTKHL